MSTFNTHYKRKGGGKLCNGIANAFVSILFACVFFVFFSAATSASINEEQEANDRIIHDKMDHLMQEEMMSEDVLDADFE